MGLQSPKRSNSSFLEVQLLGMVAEQTFTQLISISEIDPKNFSSIYYGLTILQTSLNADLLNTEIRFTLLAGGDSEAK